MFLSLPHYEFQMPAGLREPGSRHWRVVEMPLHAPWYLLTVVQPVPADMDWAPSHTLCIAWDADLVDAIKAVEAVRIRGLVAMIPAWASSTGQWASRQISEVWVDGDESGKVVTLLDCAGKQLKSGMLVEPRKEGGCGELLLRLHDKPRSLRPRPFGSGRVRSGSPRAV